MRNRIKKRLEKNGKEILRPVWCKASIQSRIRIETNPTDLASKFSWTFCNLPPSPEVSVPEGDPGTASKAREVDGIDNGGLAEGREVVWEEGEARPHTVQHHQRDGWQLLLTVTLTKKYVPQGSVWYSTRSRPFQLRIRTGILYCKIKFKKVLFCQYDASTYFK